MKVFMMTDMEGVAGIVSFEDQARPTGRYYEAGKKLVTGEINAAVQGLLEAGAEEVLVCDGHGPGAIVYEDLHPKAKLMHGRPLEFRTTGRAITDAYDVCVMVGQHAMAGVRTGNLNHTQSSASIDYYKLNGRPIGEIAQFALYQGAAGIPMIFLSGDEDACKEAEELIPGIITAPVKKGLGRGCAISLSKEAARELVRERIKEAVETHRTAPILPLQWDPPYVLEKRFFHTHVADGQAARPGAEKVDSQTVRLTSDNIREIIYA